MSRAELSEMKQRLEGMEMVLGQLRIDQKTTLKEQRDNFKEGNNSIIELKTGINNLNIKLDKEIIPYISSISMVIKTLTNIDAHLIKIYDNVIKNKETLEILKERIPVTIQGYNISTSTDDKTQEKLDLLSTGLNNIFLKEEQILTKIEWQTQRLIGKLEGLERLTNTSPINQPHTNTSPINQPPTLVDDLKEIKRLQTELITVLNKEQFSGKLQELWEVEIQNSARIDISTTKILNQIEKIKIPEIPTSSTTTSLDLGPKLSKYLNDKFGTLLPTLSTIQSELQKQQKQLFEIENNTEYTRNNQLEPIDQTTTHKKLDNLESKVNTINLKDIQDQVTKIFRETTDQTDFTQRLATAIKIGIHDRLTRIEDNLYKFISTHKVNPPTQYSTGVIGQTARVTETYFVHINDLAPDRNHFIQ